MKLSSDGSTARRWLSLALCMAALALFAWLRLRVFHDRIFPLSIGLPLLLCLWNRNKIVLHGMAVALTAITLAKIFVVLPPALFSANELGFWLFAELLNIWVVACTIHGLLSARARLLEKRHRLEALNASLEQSNQELATREEEISRQNEELQSQTEELEQQSEELRQQAEELEQQGADLQELNRELMRREKGLETLLHSGRWMRGDMSESYVMSGVCQAALQIVNDVTAAEVVAADHDTYQVLGDCGFGLQGRMDDGLSFARTFGALVVESERTAALPDIRQRPDLGLPALRAGRPLVSVIASPIWYEGKVVAVLCVYGTLPREWSEHDFGVTEWLAAQAALALQSTRVQRELETRRRDAESAALQKSQFLAAVSHDVRTPANAISLLAELLERASAAPDQAHRVPELAKSLWANARSLVDLVSDVLDLTRLDAGATELHVTEFDLGEVIEAEVYQAEAVAKGKGLTLAKSMPAETVKLATDRSKLKRVIANLLSNAVKFTERGSVRIECTVGDDVRISIADTGVGIPGESLDKVFDEFFQLRNPERNREKGAGLGLAICRRLVLALGCTLSVESVEGVGSTFTLIVPRELRAKPVLETAVDDEPAVNVRLDGLRILLVEDNDVARRSVAELLTTDGATVESALDGKTALELLQQHRYDVLLLDLNLPDMDGTGILRHLSGPDSGHLRKIVISGDARPERFAQVTDLGADQVLAKPVSLSRIREAIFDGNRGPQNGLSTTT